MKIAIRIGLASIIGLGMVWGASAVAQSLTETAFVAPVAAPQAIALPQKAEPESTTVSMSAKTPPALDAEKDKDSPSDPKVPDSVKNVVKRLNVATEDITLEDLNTAREAVAKLDILIDIEKRLTDLASIRQEREGKAMEAAIPMSALGGQGGGLPQQAAFVPSLPTGEIPSGMPVAMPMMPQENVEITRIAGAVGRYVATVKIGEGKTMLVREGEKLPDGSIVHEISSRSVTLTRDKKTRTVDVKDVAVVFHGR